jgi:hypothetical protein
MYYVWKIVWKSALRNLVTMRKFEVYLVCFVLKQQVIHRN